MEDEATSIQQHENDSTEIPTESGSETPPASGTDVTQADQAKEDNPPDSVDRKGPVSMHLTTSLLKTTNRRAVLPKSATAVHVDNATTEKVEVTPEDFALNHVVHAVAADDTVTADDFAPKKTTDSVSVHVPVVDGGNERKDKEEVTADDFAPRKSDEVFAVTADDFAPKKSEVATAWHEDNETKDKEEVAAEDFAPKTSDEVFAVTADDFAPKKSEVAIRTSESDKKKSETEWDKAKAVPIALGMYAKLAGQETWIDKRARDKAEFEKKAAEERKKKEEEEKLKYEEDQARKKAEADKEREEKAAKEKERKEKEAKEKKEREALFQSVLYKGATFVKYGRKGGGKKRVIFLREDGKLFWATEAERKAKREKKFVDISLKEEGVEIIPGSESFTAKQGGLWSVRKKAVDSRCFRIVTGRWFKDQREQQSERALLLEASNQEQRDLWVNTLRLWRESKQREQQQLEEEKLKKQQEESRQKLLQEQAEEKAKEEEKAQQATLKAREEARQGVEAQEAELKAQRARMEAKQKQREQEGDNNPDPAADSAESEEEKLIRLQKSLLKTSSPASTSKEAVESDEAKLIQMQKARLKTSSTPEKAENANDTPSPAKLLQQAKENMKKTPSPMSAGKAGKEIELEPELAAMFAKRRLSLDNDKKVTPQSAGPAGKGAQAVEVSPELAAKLKRRSQMIDASTVPGEEQISVQEQVAEEAVEKRGSKEEQEQQASEERERQASEEEQERQASKEEQEGQASKEEQEQASKEEQDRQASEEEQEQQASKEEQERQVSEEEQERQASEEEKEQQASKEKQDRQASEKPEQPSSEEEQEQQANKEQERQASEEEQEQQASKEEQERQASEEQKQQATEEEQEQQATEEEQERQASEEEQEQASKEEQEGQVSEEEQEQQASKEEQERQASEEEQERQVSEEEQERQTSEEEQEQASKEEQERQVSKEEQEQQASKEEQDRQLAEEGEAGEATGQAEEPQRMAEETTGQAEEPQRMAEETTGQAEEPQRVAEEEAATSWTNDMVAAMEKDMGDLEKDMGDLEQAAEKSLESLEGDDVSAPSGDELNKAQVLVAQDFTVGEVILAPWTGALYIAEVLSVSKGGNLTVLFIEDQVEAEVSARDCRRNQEEQEQEEVETEAEQKSEQQETEQEQGAQEGLVEEDGQEEEDNKETQTEREQGNDKGQAKEEEEEEEEEAEEKEQEQQQKQQETSPEHPKFVEGEFILAPYEGALGEAQVFFRAGDKLTVMFIHNQMELEVAASDCKRKEDTAGVVSVEQEIARLSARGEELEKQLDELTSYASRGSLLYRLNSTQREQLVKAWEGIQTGQERQQGQNPFAELVACYQTVREEKQGLEEELAQTKMDISNRVDRVQSLKSEVEDLKNKIKRTEEAAAASAMKPDRKQRNSKQENQSSAEVDVDDILIQLKEGELPAPLQFSVQAFAPSAKIKRSSGMKKEKAMLGIDFLHQTLTLKTKKPSENRQHPFQVVLMSDPSPADPTHMVFSFTEPNASPIMVWFGDVDDMRKFGQIFSYLVVLKKEGLQHQKRESKKRNDASLKTGSLEATPASREIKRLSARVEFLEQLLAELSSYADSPQGRQKNPITDFITRYHGLRKEFKGLQERIQATQMELMNNVERVLSMETEVESLKAQLASQREAHTTSPVASGTQKKSSLPLPRIFRR